jgi:hypothetical protein
MSTKLEGEAVVGLAPNAMLLPARPSARHHALLSSYLLNLERGPIAVRDMIVTDLSIFLDLGASQRVAGLLIVLRLFFAEHPEAGYRRVRRGHPAPGVPLCGTRSHAVVDRVCAIIFARPGVSRLNPEAKPWLTNFFRNWLGS